LILGIRELWVQSQIRLSCKFVAQFTDKITKLSLHARWNVWADFDLYLKQFWSTNSKFIQPHLGTYIDSHKIYIHTIFIEIYFIYLLKGNPQDVFPPHSTPTNPRSFRKNTKINKIFEKFFIFCVCCLFLYSMSYFTSPSGIFPCTQNWMWTIYKTKKEKGILLFDPCWNLKCFILHQ